MMPASQLGLDSTPARWTGLALDHLDPDLERPFWIATSLIPGLGPVAVAGLVTACGGLRRAWHEGAVDVAVARLPDATRTAARQQLTHIRHDGVLRIAAERMTAARLHGATVVTAVDSTYPPALAQVDPRPPVLWISGSADAWVEPGVAVVGTRRPSGYGRAAAEEIGDELARAGRTVISGLAIGIDGVAHTAALAAGGRTIAVLPSPVDRIYPPVHRALARLIRDGGGALVTEVPPGQTVGRPDFARRNRIIAGLAEAVVVVEAPDHSGALLTADAAIGYGRELFAVPGPMDADTSRGTNRLIADHLAALLTSPSALLHQVGRRTGSPAVSVRTLSEAEGLVLGLLMKRPASIEELVTRTHLGTPALAATLTMLEARGLVTAYAGATFHPTLAARRSGYRGKSSDGVPDPAMSAPGASRAILRPSL